MMKVLFNTPNQNLTGGPPTHLFMLEKALSTHVNVVPFEYGRKSDTETIFQKVVGRLSDLITTRRILKRSQPDIIHHNSAFDPRAILRDVPLVWLAKKFHVPILIKIHGSLPEAFTTQSRLVQWARQYVITHATAFGVLSVAEKNEFEDEYHVVRGKMHVVKNILKETFFSTVRKEAQEPTVLFVSRFIKRKGVFDLLNAIPSVLELVPQAKFVFVGDGPDAAEFDRCVKAMHLSAIVTRLASVANSATSEFYTKAWVLAFPTHFPEGMPMVIAEAMAAGVPTVTTRTRFSNSYMKEGTHCLFTKHGDSLEIAGAITRLLLDNNLRNEMSLALRNCAKEFTADNVSKEFNEIYKKILGDVGNQEVTTDTTQPHNQYKIVTKRRVVA